jgi:Ca2+-binding RTX toxin-like protein
MALFTYQTPAAENYTGGSDNDLFVASNNFLNAGDTANGSGGIDDFQYFADTSLTGGVAGVDVFGNAVVIKTFAAFQLNSVETFTTINDSGQTLVFDMSSSVGLTDVVVSNSTSAVVYDELATLANVRLVKQTNALTTNVAVGYEAALTAGAATSVNLVLDNTNGNIVRIGTSTGTVGQPLNTGVEIVHLTGLNGNSTINTLDNASLTTLIVDDVVGSAFGVTITAPLSPTVTTVTNNSDGAATINASASAQAVTFTGQAGADNFTGGAFNDVFNLGNGNNTAVTGGGNNTVTTGTGVDLVLAQGGSDTVSTGDGNDTVVDTTTVNLTLNAGTGSDAYVGIGGNFDAGVGNDTLNMGAGFDVIFSDAGVVDADFAQATGAEGFAVYTAGASTLAANAQAAGVNSIYLGSGGAGNDNVDASAFTSRLTVTSSGNNSAAPLTTEAGRAARFGSIDSVGGGDDTVTTGNKTDQFLFRGDAALTSADNLSGGASTDATAGEVGDALYLEGDTTLTGAGTNGFNGVEIVLLESAVGSLYRTQAPGAGFGNQYSLTLTDANAPTSGSLFINGTNLKGAVAGVNANESVVVDVTAVTTFALNVATGGGTDTIILGGAAALAAQVSTGAGADVVVESAGNAVNDLIDTGLGDDTVILVGGNNTVFDAGGNNTIQLGVGNDTVLTGTGNDLILAGGGVLTGTDLLADAGGYDAIFVNTAVTDAMFVNVNPTNAAISQYEVLFASGANTITLGANAARTGFTTLVGDGAAQTFNINNASFAKGMLVDLSAGGNDVVNLGSPTAIAAPNPLTVTPAGLFDFIGPVVGGFVWPPVGGFPAAPDSTANANLVVAGTGTQTVNGGSGSDVLRVNLAEMDATDVFAGAGGYDAVQFDNNASAGGVTATVNLTNVTSVELFQTLGSGDRLASPTVDIDVNTITFTGGAVGTLTTMKLDNSAMSDPVDTTRYVLAAGLTDADFAFTVFGGAAGTTIVDKQNLGVNNNINFQGGAGQDIIQITGGDLGSTTIFNGAAGILDTIIQTGGVITDDSYSSVDNVEILTATAGNLNANLGAQAAGSGLTTITGTSGNDFVLLDAAFTSPLAISLGGGNDTFNAQNAIGTMTFSETLTNITAADTVVGGANGADVFNINAAGGGSGDLTNVAGIENYNVSANSGDAVDLVLGAGAVNGAQVFNLIGNAGTTNVSLTLHGAAATANTTVNALNGVDAITTGAGNDIVNAGGGADSIFGNGGADTLNGQGGSDEISGGLGNDTLSGGDAADKLRGQGGNDQIFGDAGNDTIYGGTGGDFIDGGTGADVFLYDGTVTGDSPFGARDTVRVGTGDTFDFGIPVTFVGSQASFGDAQSAISAGGPVEAVFQADTNILWLDVNNDGTLNNYDIQINIQFSDGLVALTGANFPATATTVAAFDASFAPAV